MEELPAIDPSPSAFETFARLFAVASSDITTSVVDAGDDWDPSLPEQAGGPTVWGGLATYGGGPLRAAMRRALMRERALRSVRRLGGTQVEEIHRLSPSLRASRMRRGVRLAIRGGVLVEIGRGTHERVIDLVLRDAGAAADANLRLSPRGDGSAIGPFLTRAGEAAILRVTAGDAGAARIRRNAEALEVLERAAVGRVPRILGQGSVAGAVWSAETRLDGRLKASLRPTVAREAIGFSAGLPRQARATSLAERMRALAELHPRWAPVLHALAATPIEAPGILQHGDLWTRNLLIHRRHLSGVIDWETWHPNGLPGTDLLQLIATDRRTRAGGGIGALWLARVWQSKAFSTLARPYWAAMGITPEPELLDAVGLDWWAGQVARHHRLASRPDWVRDNVDQVLDRVGDRR